VFFVRGKSILVFPINISESAIFAKTARELGLRVVSATSETILADEKNAGIVSLPYITDPDFNQSFFELLEGQEIDLVFSPHPGVWAHLQSLAKRGTSPVAFSVCNEPPLDTNWLRYGAAYQWAQSCAGEWGLASPVAAALSPTRYANLHFGYNQIPGQNDDVKLLLLTHIVRSAPSGDVVEVGSLYGRSAFALAWLAKFHAIGAVVCVDPWDAVSIKDQGDEAILLNRQAYDVDWEKIFSGFIASMSGFDNVNYIRQPSSSAYATYTRGVAAGGICSDEFGETRVCGEISILHIDGNHKYDDVRLDVDTWVPSVKHGGWVLVDDYLWAFGDGPRRAGNEILQEYAIETAFVAGDTLCIQLR
jgi:hypothetical protein